MKTVFKVIPYVILFTLLGVFSSCNQQTDQVSATVIGPINQTYKLPKVPGAIYYVSPDGDANFDGLNLAQPTSIEAAFGKVVTGDAIVMRGGIYRTGNLTFNQGIVIQAYADEKPVLNGTLVADSWSEVNENLWVTNWEFLFPAGPEEWWNESRNIEFTPLHRFNNDGVFVDGQFLQSAGSVEEVKEGSFYVDYTENKIYIGTNPKDRLIEITAFRKALYRTLGAINGKEADKKGPVIRGITFTQYPDTMVHIGGVGLAIDQHGNDIVGTVIDNCIFSNCFRIGFFAISDSLVMQNCHVVNTNTEGVYIVASSDVLLERNIFENNNIENWTGFYPSSVKIFNQSHRAIVRKNNVVNHPYSNGVWWDVGNKNGEFVNNHVENVSHSGLFFEISDGAIVAGNVFENCDQSIFVLNASNVEVYNNTMINSRVNFRRDNRGDQDDTFGWHVTLGPGVEERDGHVFVNNLLYMNKEKNALMFQTGQPPFMCERLNKPHLKAFNNNVFVQKSIVGDSTAIIQLVPYQNEKCQLDIITSKELNELSSDISVNCQYFDGFDGSLFVDAANKNFQLTSEFSNKGAVAATIPDHVAKSMGVKAGQVPFIGAVAP